MANALLVRWADGYMEVTDAASITAVGRHEEFLSLGNAKSTEEATRAAEAALANIVSPERITAQVEPAGGDEPYADWGVGDTVTVPDSTGSPVTRRVTSITVGEDEEGEPIYVPELAP